MVSKQELMKKDEAHWFHPLGTAAESPHFTFTEEELDHALDVTYSVLKEIKPV